jgi:membrane protease YdiL (CAAX protease family)
MTEDNRAPHLDERTVLTLGFLGETFFGGIALLWIKLDELHVQMPLDPTSVILGVLFTFPLLFVGIVLIENHSIGSKIPEYEFFRNEVVVPLCLALSPGGALLIALASGFCEELFFRGALLSALHERLGFIAAGLISSLLFAIVHFIGVVWRFRVLILLYTTAGVYLWLVAVYCGDLLSVMITHALYNYCVIRFVQKKYSQTPPETQF